MQVSGTYEGHARRRDPDTSKQAAKKISSLKKEQTNALWDKKGVELTLMGATQILVADFAARGLILNQDLVSGHMNMLALTGHLATDGKTAVNPNSKKKALLWRRATKEELEYIQAFTGCNDTSTKTKFVSGDYIIKEFKKLTVAQVEGDLEQKLYKGLPSWFRTKLKYYEKGLTWAKHKRTGKGITWLMKHYDVFGKKRRDVHD